MERSQVWARLLRGWQARLLRQQIYFFCHGADVYLKWQRNDAAVTLGCGSSTRQGGECPGCDWVRGWITLEKCMPTLVCPRLVAIPTYRVGFGLQGFSLCTRYEKRLSCNGQMSHQGRMLHMYTLAEWPVVDVQRLCVLQYVTVLVVE